MRFISTRAHGALDYIVGLLLIFAPQLFQLPPGAASRIPVMLGVAALIYSLITRYELSVAKLIPMKVHLTFDLLSGVLLAASPWLFGFADQVWVPHVLVGVLEIGASLMTRVESTVAPSTPTRTVM